VFLTAIVAALAAAILYGIGAALQQYQAAAAPREAAGRPSLLLLLVRRPWWVLGISAELAAFTVHAFALGSGPLTVVQMLTASSLIFSVATVRLWSGRRLGWTGWGAAGAVVAGIGAFVVLTASGVPGAHGVPGRAGIAAACLAATAAPFAAGGLAADGRRRAALLAVGAGLADACVAVVTMVFSHTVGHGLTAIGTSWATYALMIGGPCSLLLTQTAYQAGRPMLTLPIVTVVSPVASLAVGAGLLGEATRISAARGIAAGLAVLVTAAGLAGLARLSSADPDPWATRPRSSGEHHPGRPARWAAAIRGPVSPAARQFLLAACAPAAGSMAFWAFPVCGRSDGPVAAGLRAIGSPGEQRTPVLPSSPDPAADRAHPGVQAEQRRAHGGRDGDLEDLVFAVPGGGQPFDVGTGHAVGVVADAGGV
jgi:hypothetical protein